VCKELGRPFPSVSDDDVIDYVVAEAVTMKVTQQREQQQSENERADWRGSHKTFTGSKELT
jgi:hypothetical protein